MADLLGLDVVRLPQVEPIKVVLACRKNLNDRGLDWFVEQIKSVLV